LTDVCDFCKSDFRLDFGPADADSCENIRFPIHHHDCEVSRMPGRSLLTLPELATDEDVSPWRVDPHTPTPLLVAAEEDEDAAEDEEDDDDDDLDEEFDDDELDDEDLDDDDFDDEDFDDEDFDDDDFDDDDDDDEDEDDDDEED
jgi:hypothetical protein